MHTLWSGVNDEDAHTHNILAAAALSRRDDGRLRFYFLAVLPVCSAALREPGRYAYGFTPGSCTCRRVPPAVRTPTEDSPAVRGDVRWRVWEETTVKRLAMARWCCEGQLCPSASR
ncbi:chitin binding-like protein [Trypanosoma cruzi cruzi]|nr:chitin binding-like protein [Trypanosoma cruzi cruzi]